MTSEELNRLRYPIGPQPFTPVWTVADVQENIGRIAQLPQALRELVSGLSSVDFQKQYRPDSWTVAQVIHHVADSHINAYVRTRWCLTEQEPVIKAYNENAWSALADSDVVELIDNTLDLLSALHKRWVYLLHRVETEQWSRKWIHPDMKEPRQLAHIPEIYSWHGEHHLGHIKLALQNN